MGYTKYMKLVVAVSGGVDSVVLLDVLVKSAVGTSASHELQGEERFSELTSENLAEGQAPPGIIIAHFDHGIRDDSAEDARFVAGLAKRYGLPFVTKREELGPDASEELARVRRYAFLRQLAEKHEARIVTAHHMNDIAETVAINLTRGTGWRGLAVLDSDIYRPLLAKTKQELIDYAIEHQLEWCEDSTNSSNAYLRNRLRTRIAAKAPLKDLAALRMQQIALKQQIDREVTNVAGESPYHRYFFSQLEPAVAIECLRGITEARLTRPQMERLLLAIKTYKAGSCHEAGAGIKVDFTTRHFSLKMIK